MTLTPAQAAAEQIIGALEMAQEYAPDEMRETYERVLLIATESGVLVDRNGAAVADLLTDLYHAMPTPKTDKLSKAWQATMPTVFRPRYRINGIEPAAEAIILTDTQTGEQRVWEPGETAENMRAAFARTNAGSGTTALGIGVCGMHEELAAELIERGNR